MGGKSSKQSRCIVVGLDNSGKSTIINSLKPEKEKKQETFATVGFQAESFKHGTISFTMWDMSGQGRYRNLW
jgi:ADP-ribosylation factor-like protein 6